MPPSSKRKRPGTTRKTTTITTISADVPIRGKKVIFEDDSPDDNESGPQPSNFPIRGKNAGLDDDIALDTISGEEGDQEDVQEAEDEDDDDDDAPEAVSFGSGAAEAKASQARALAAQRTQEAHAKQKRRDRDERLREQAANRKPDLSSLAEADANSSNRADREMMVDESFAEDHSSEDEDLLSDDLLDDIPDDLSDRSDMELTGKNKSVPLATPRKNTIIKLSDSTASRLITLPNKQVRLLAKENPRLAPRIASQSAAVHRSWLKGSTTMGSMARKAKGQGKKGRSMVRTGRVVKRPYGSKAAAF